MGGRRIHPPSKMPNTRPTTDIAREGLFNIIENNLTIEGMRTLDLFGGTGSISYELYSRGASDITVVEKDPAMHAFIMETSKTLGCEHFKVVRMDVFRYIEQCNEQFDFIFAGPPYALTTIDELPVRVFEKKLLKETGWFVLEHTPRNEYRDSPHFATMRNYGTTVFSVFVRRD